MTDINFFFFFFSSRRRHTRLQGDWSSDVCSSDLTRDSVGGAASGLRVVRLRASALTTSLRDDKWRALCATFARPTRPQMFLRSEERRVGKEQRTMLYRGR